MSTSLKHFGIIVALSILTCNSFSQLSDSEYFLYDSADRLVNSVSLKNHNFYDCSIAHDANALMQPRLASAWWYTLAIRGWGRFSLCSISLSFKSKRKELRLLKPSTSLLTSGSGRPSAVRAKNSRSPISQYSQQMGSTQYTYAYAKKTATWPGLRRCGCM
jgi:hypothetical protein